jgi:hypothetical protein
MEPLATVGHHYLYDEWLMGNIYLKNNQKINNRFLKYDIDNKCFEIKTDNEIKVLKLERVDNFDLHHKGLIRKYTNAYNYTLADNSRLIGVFEILADGYHKLLCKTELQLIRSNYVAAIDMGSKADKISRRRELYILTDKMVHQVPKNKNNLFTIFGSESDTAKAYVKENNLRFNKEKDLAELITYLNNQKK